MKYGASFGFLGLYLVKPEHRGQGYGLQLWNAGLAHLGQRTIGLDGVVAQQRNYLHSGFELASIAAICFRELPLPGDCALPYEASKDVVESQHSALLACNVASHG